MDKIENGLTEDELRLCFMRFDLNNDNRITFEEFYRTLCKINGEPSYVGKFNKDKENNSGHSSSNRSPSQGGGKEI